MWIFDRCLLAKQVIVQLSDSLGATENGTLLNKNNATIFSIRTMIQS